MVSRRFVSAAVKRRPWPWNASTEAFAVPVGASLLAMDVNDDAGRLDERGVLTFFVGSPPGASSLLQGAIKL
ncbi:hypothetical protein EMIT0196MI5_110102 [Pseudomonas sp. IT-196MI5]